MSNFLFVFLDLYIMSDVVDLKMTALLDVRQMQRALIEYLFAEGETPVNIHIYFLKNNNM